MGTRHRSSDRAALSEHAAMAPRKAMLRPLIEQKGSNVNNINGQWGSTPLHYAASAGQLNVFMELLSLKADPNIKDKSGNIPVDNGPVHMQQTLKGYLKEHRRKLAAATSAVQLSLTDFHLEPYKACCGLDIHMGLCSMKK